MQIVKTLDSMIAALKETRDSKNQSLARRKECARILTKGIAELGEVVNDRAAAFIAQQEGQGYRFISIEEVAKRLDCPVKAVLRGFRAGRYPFIIADGNGGRVASEDGMERWMKESVRHEAIFFWVDENEVTICEENENGQAEGYLQIIQERGEQTTEIILSPKDIEELYEALRAGELTDRRRQSLPR